MKILVNGKELIFPEKSSLSQLLEILKIDSPRIACELNQQVVKKAGYSVTMLKEGDNLEIIQFMGGG
ncbi:MAG: sulfur carrier protein ThiS [Elusimicrobiota bacterium]